jgi:orotate phosphoribosyltransferase
VQETVLNLLDARTGHFGLESGHHGELWLELDAIAWSAAAVDPVVAGLAERIAPHAVDAVCGPLTGGAFLAQPVAARLGVGFAHTERVPGGSGGLYPAEYRLPDALAVRLAGRRVAVVDDVINAGSATRATLSAVRAAGGHPAVLAAMLALGSTPAHVAVEAGLPLEPLATLENTIWAPADCPLCARGVPLRTR